MKKLLLLGAMVLMLVACEQKEKQEQDPTEKKEVFIPQGVPVAPMQQIQIQEKGGVDPTALGDPNGPVLKLEEGMPLDFSQLQGQKMSVEDHVASQIDSIRYKAEQGDAKFQYAYGVCYEKGWGVEQNTKEALAWFRKAAAQENGPAYNSLGNYYRMGTGVTADQLLSHGHWRNRRPKTSLGVVPERGTSQRCTSHVEPWQLLLLWDGGGKK